MQHTNGICPLFPSVPLLLEFDFLKHRFTLLERM